MGISKSPELPIHLLTQGYSLNNLLAKVWEFPSLQGVPGKGWLLVEATPLPPSEELELVAGDIEKNREIEILNGQLRHYSRCIAADHSIQPALKRTILSLSKQRFSIAIYPGEPNLLGGQPIAIPLVPSISFYSHPGHPHLNIDGGWKRIDGQPFFLPTSICYTHDITALGMGKEIRLENAIGYIIEWLFRHQIWDSTPSDIKCNGWIGHAKNHPSFLGWHLRSPFYNCHCGTKVPYFQCHLKKDIQKCVPHSVSKADTVYNRFMRSEWFETAVAHNCSIRALQKAMLM